MAGAIAVTGDVVTHLLEGFELPLAGALVVFEGGVGFLPREGVEDELQGVVCKGEHLGDELLFAFTWFLLGH